MQISKECDRLGLRISKSEDSTRESRNELKWDKGNCVMNHKKHVMKIKENKSNYKVISSQINNK